MGEIDYKGMNVFQKINEVKKVVKVLKKDAETSGKGAYSYVSGAQILALIKDKMESQIPCCRAGGA